MLDSTYTLLAETVEGVTSHYIFFIDGQGDEQIIDLTPSLYKEFLKFVKLERNLKRWIERHEERFELGERELQKRMLHPPKCLDDIVYDNLRNERVNQAIDNLTETQRRRFIMYYEFEMTYEQIAELEGCIFQAVAKSIKLAENKIKKFLW